MSHLIEVPFAGGSITVATIKEQDDAQAYGIGELVDKAEDSIEDMLNTVKSLGKSIAESLKEMECSSAEVSLGVGFTGKGKFIVAEASAAASLNIKLTFDKPTGE